MNDKELAVLRAIIKQVLGKYKKIPGNEEDRFKKFYEARPEILLSNIDIDVMNKFINEENMPSKETVTKRKYVNIHYDLKEEAKKLLPIAWDKEKKSWYLTKDLNEYERASLNRLITETNLIEEARAEDTDEENWLHGSYLND